MIYPYIREQSIYQHMILVDLHRWTWTLIGTFTTFRHDAVLSNAFILLLHHWWTRDSFSVFCEL